MASTINQQFKITKFAKDLGMKSKDLVELLAQNGIEAKTTQKALEPLEFDILFESLTQANQITDIGSYLDGVTYIPSKPKKVEKAAKAEQVEKAEEAQKPETAEAPKKAEKVEKVEKTEKIEKPAEKKEAAPKSEPASAPKAKEEAPTARPQNVAEKKAEEKKEEKQATGAPAAPAAPAKEAAPAARPAARQPYTGNPFRPQQNSAAGITVKQMPTQPAARPAPTQQQRAPQGQQPAFGGAKRPESFGGGRPQGGTDFGGQKKDRGSFNKNNDRGGRGGFDRDKGDFVQSAPKDTFKAQPIVRGASTNINPDGTRKGPRVIDTHTSTVDLSKYDERLDSFVSDRDQNLAGGNQKLKKQNNAAQQGQNAFGKGNKNGKKDKGRKGSAPVVQQPVNYKPTSVEIGEEIVVGQLASKLHVTAGEVVKKLIMMGMMATINQVIDFDTAALVADEFGIEATPEVVVSIEERLFDDAVDTDEQLQERAPVVCVMGHVDHGKTSILDAIRHTNVTRGEAGGITQAIGAYRVKANDKDITFLDTPGHEAFTAMRMRGAKSTDIAILVVAADDGVMPQTVEAINHAKAAGIDIIVAINKMDKPTANPDNVLNQLTQYELVPEAWGGDVITVPVSAHTGMGIEDLLENVLLVAEVKELRANPKRRAAGLVIESKLDKGRGPVATVLVQNGTLHQGDYVIVGNAVGRVRAMVDDKGKTVKVAGPSVPVEIIGLDEVPQAGDELNAVEDERMAKNLAEQRKERLRQEILQANSRVNLDELFGQIAAGVQTLNIVVKADVAGSVEAVKASLLKLSNEEVKVSVIHSAVGGITESDVMLAAASNAIICGFNVRPDRNALDSAERNKVDIRCHRIIYEIIDEIEAAMKGLLAPEFREVLLGHAEVRQTIKVPGVGIIAGCYIQDGKIIRSAQIRIVRDGIVIFEDKISSLRRFKDDVKEVNSGYECGVGIEKFNDIREGDTLEAFIMEEIAR